MKPLIVGQAPGPRGLPRGVAPFGGGASAKRLAALCGLSVEEFAARYDRTNVLIDYHGKSGKGDAFPLTLAREAFDLLMPHLPGRRVVLLGANVARAAGMHRLPLLKWQGNIAVCPHPSGINRWWNDPRNTRAARRFWRALTEETA